MFELHKIKLNNNIIDIISLLVFIYLFNWNCLMDICLKYSHRCDGYNEIKKNIIIELYDYL